MGKYTDILKKYNDKSEDDLKKYIKEREKKSPGFKKKVEKASVKLSKNKRKCSVCNKIGHNARTCPNKNKTQENIPMGHQILQEQKKKIQRKDIDGIIPKKGMWLINPKTKKVAGKISYINKKGEIVWEDSLGTFITSSHETISNSGYKYVDIIEPSMLRWNIVGI